MKVDGQLASGRRIDRYELRELIGEGGMGAVYRATDSRLGRTVAIKTVLANRAGGGLSDELRQRFMREALAASKVAHRNVVQVLDFGVDELGMPYLVMEHLRGEDLGALLRRSRDLLPIEYVADVMLGVCAALRACHHVGIVHRDLKPSNIFLADTDTGAEVKVLDFGVSKASMADELTQEGQILGTPQYLSPEQVNGRVGPESDQYALGVLLYVCLTKRLPFEEHQNLSLLRAIDLGRFDGPRKHRPDIPQTLEDIILRAMHADPLRRFPTVHALGQRLWQFASPRGQLEWKNYYFHTPPAPMGADGTLRGVPLAPDVSRVPIGPTELMAPPSNDLLAPSSPQMSISTKLAKPDAEMPGTGAGASELAFLRKRSRAPWLIAAFGCAAALVVVVAMQGRRSEIPATISSPAGAMPPPITTRPELEPSIAPPAPGPSAASETSRLAGAAKPAPAEQDPPKPVVAQPAAKFSRSSAAPQPHPHAHRTGGRKRAGAGEGPATPPTKTSLDPNGIGIPTE
jgi:eukaryotic-like serine/threonine-protein kinase